MSDPGTTTVITVLGRRGEAQWARARASLAQGRHADALEAVRRARRLRSAEDAPLVALVEGDALFGLQRYGEAVGVATRALRRQPLEPDLQARLRVLRGHGLWLAGRIRSGSAEVRRAAEEALQPLTRGRVHETLALFAWKEQALERAAEHVRSAHEAYAGRATPAALARVLAKEAGVLRDLGRLDEALVVQDRRLQAAAGSGRADAMAEARVDRAGLLAALGRWDEAAGEIDIAIELCARAGHGPEAAGVTAVVIDLARGDLPRARARLALARERTAERGNVRGLAEALLLASDLHLAARQVEDAERTATEALDLFRVVRDGEGQCRSRVRRAHALVEMGRCPDAAAEARRALGCATPSRADLVALGQLALGRACIRLDRAAAREAFARARSSAGAHVAFEAASALGLALVDGAARDDARVQDAIAALERWGDRRVLAICLADLAELAPRRAGPAPAAATEAWPPRAEGPDAIVEAAGALLAEGAWPDRWAAAMRAIQPAFPWWRAALVCEPGLELRGDLDHAVKLPSRDLARDLASAGCDGVVRLDAGEWAAHPTRVLHGLSAAILCRAWEGAHLYVDVREGADLGRAGVVADLARLLGNRPPDPAGARAPAGGFPGIVGDCAPLRDLLATLARVAPSDLTVHVSGETGTGKEAIAKALHARSTRARGPFVAVNASSFGDELFETEMFGHGRGAFTGAVGERDGYVAAAEGGTLFLDEVADLTPRAQARLLRFLEEREYRRVGETRIRRADVRVVTAANAPLSCRLRPDLVFRLEEIVLALPPLRERGADLWLLVRHFLAESARAARVETPTLSVEARRALAAHSWPGNVRELRGEMRRAVVLAGGETIRPEHLGEALRVTAPPRKPGLREALHAFERDYLARELARNGARRARTAAALGITRQALAAKMARLGL
jgi:transcriptional regulator with AAA-type ATPase domain/tetratricopeptide (TPR) repeat protein